MELGFVLGLTLLSIGMFLQTFGSLLLLGGYAPQIIKLHKTKIPTGISLLFWTMIGIGCTSILVNMIIQDTSVEVVVTQGLNAIGAWYTLGLVIYCRKLNNSSIKVNKGIMLVAVLIVLFMALYCVTHTLPQAGYAFQTVGTIALLTAYLPQIWHLNKVKDATGVSRWLFVVLGLGLLCVTGNMIITKTDVTIIITEFVNIALIFIQYCMTVHYQQRKK